MTAGRYIAAAIIVAVGTFLWASYPPPKRPIPLPFRLLFALAASGIAVFVAYLTRASAKPLPWRRR